jgi:hypothetical protein
MVSLLELFIPCFRNASLCPLRGHRGLIGLLIHQYAQACHSGSMDFLTATGGQLYRLPKTHRSKNEFLSQCEYAYY